MQYKSSKTHIHFSCWQWDMYREKTLGLYFSSFCMNINKQNTKFNQKTCCWYLKKKETNQFKLKRTTRPIRSLRIDPCLLTMKHIEIKKKRSIHIIISSTQSSSRSIHEFLTTHSLNISKSYSCRSIFFLITRYSDTIGQ